MPVPIAIPATASQFVSTTVSGQNFLQSLFGSGLQGKIYTAPVQYTTDYLIATISNIPYFNDWFEDPSQSASKWLAEQSIAFQKPDYIVQYLENKDKYYHIIAGYFETSDINGLYSYLQSQFPEYFQVSGLGSPQPEIIIIPDEKPVIPKVELPDLQEYVNEQTFISDTVIEKKPEEIQAGLNTTSMLFVGGAILSSFLLLRSS